MRIDFKTVVFIRAKPGKKETTDGSGSRVNFIQKQCTFLEVHGKSRKMVCDQYQAMGLVIPPKTYPHRPNAYSHCHVYSSLTCSGQGSGNEIILPVWSHAIFWNLALPEKCTDPERKCMRTQSVCGFFLTSVGSYENHCFGINAHTFLFQVGHPIS